MNERHVIDNVFRNGIIRFGNFDGKFVGCFGWKIGILLRKDELRDGLRPIYFDEISRKISQIDLDIRIVLEMFAGEICWEELLDSRVHKKPGTAKNIKYI